MKRKTFFRSLLALTGIVISNPIKLFGKEDVPEKRVDGAAWKLEGNTKSEKIIGTTWNWEDLTLPDWVKYTRVYRTKK